MKIVGYIRVSTEKQDVGRQKMLIEKWATANNHVVVNYVEDWGISGAKGVSERKGFASLFELDNSICDIVVISEFSRYSREESTLSVMNSLLDIVNRGIEIYILNTNKFIRKGFDSDLISIITLAVESKAAWDERSKIRERMSSGKIQKNLDKPQYNGGKSILFGYKVVDKIIEVDEEDAAIVKDIFAKYIAKWNSIDIVRYLRSNYPNKRKWEQSIISMIIQHQQYTGIRTFKGNSIYFPTLRIISDAEFERAQLQLKENKKTLKGNTATHNATALLRGLLICKHCGGTISLKVKKNAHPHYRCCTYIDRGSNKECDNNVAISAKKLETILRDVYRDKFFQNESKSNTATLMNEIDKDIDKFKDVAAAKNEALASITKKRNKFRDMALEYDYDADMIKDKESSFKNEITALTIEIADTDKEIARLNTRKKMLSSSTGNVEITDKELFEKNLKRIDVSTTVDYIKLEVVGIWNNIDIIYIDRKNVYQYYYHYIDVPIEVSYKDAIAHNLFRKEYKIERAARCSKKKGMN